MHPASSRRESFQVVIASAALVTITTAGVLFGLGLRAGDALLIFRLAGAYLVGASATNVVGSVVAGLLHHLLIATAWGMSLSYGALRLHGLTRLVACVLLIPVYVWIAPRFIPEFLRIGHAVTSASADLFPIAAAISVALLGGAWVAKRD